MVLNALDRDAEKGITVRGEMAADFRFRTGKLIDEIEAVMEAQKADAARERAIGDLIAWAELVAENLQNSEPAEVAEIVSRINKEV